MVSIGEDEELIRRNAHSVSEDFKHRVRIGQRKTGERRLRQQKQVESRHQINNKAVIGMRRKVVISTFSSQLAKKPLELGSCKDDAFSLFTMRLLPL